MQRRNTRPLFIAIALTAVMVNLDSTATNLAIKTMAEQLQMNMATAQWVIDGFSMATAAFIAFGGRCGDVFGKKKIFLSGLIFFGISSAAIAFSPNATCVILSRILQGMSLAFCLPLAVALIRDVFPANQVGLMTGWIISIGSISQAIGPTLGGFIIHFSSWRWIFLVNIPVIAFAVYIIYHYLPNTKPTKKEKLDQLGLYYLVIGLTTLLVACNELAKPVLDPLDLLLLFSVSLVSLSLFVQREWYYHNPLLNIRAIINPDFARVLAIRIIISLNYISWIFLFGLLLQSVFNYSTVQTGLVLLALTLAMALVSQHVGKVIDKKGVREIKMTGLAIMFFVNATFAVSFYYLNLPFIIVLFVLAGASTAICVTTTGVATIQAVEADKTSTATGIQMTAAFTGGALGIALTSAILSKLSHWRLDGLLAQQQITLPANIYEKVMHSASGLQNVPMDLLANNPQLLQVIPTISKQSFGFGFSACMLLYALLGLISLACCHALPKRALAFE